MTDFVRDQGGRLLGTRVRRLSEAIDRAVTEIYRELGVPFEPRWAALMNLLAQRGSTTVTQAAAELGLSHVAVVQVLNVLVAEGLVAGMVDPEDRRRRNLTLTPSGKRLIKRLQPIWDAIAAESDALLATEAPLFFSQLEHLEEALGKRPLATRFRERLQDKTRKRRGK